MPVIDYVINQSVTTTPGSVTKPFSKAEITPVWGFHKSLANYSPTPLLNLPNLARGLGVGSIYLKDESYRFGLNAFKVLGASYAIARYICEQSNVDIIDLSFAKLKALGSAQRATFTFTTATDGNHGRAVAWAAQQLGHKAVIYLPKGASEHRLQAILATGAEATITDLNYDDAVRLAAEQAERNGWHVIQDTAWPGYESIPLWIMQGYATILQEITEQLAGGPPPTHVMLQAGVGSLAGALQAALVEHFGEDSPCSIIIEPENAACYLKSMRSGEGRPLSVTGDLQTIMAGLSCGEPNPLGWEILRHYSKAFVACSDKVAELGMQILARPVATDPRAVSGESGAVGIGLLAVLSTPQGEELRQKLGIDGHSRVLCISTEGDTDPDSYRAITGERV